MFSKMAVAAIAFTGLLTSLEAQAPRPSEQPLIIKSTVGSELFRFYCSNCHGLDAKGRAATSAMRTAAPDLTALSAKHGGVFPRADVEAVIRHGSPSTSAHGSKEMPVWGAIFRGLDANDTLVQVRIENLVKYLESIQGGSRERPSR